MVHDRMLEEVYTEPVRTGSTPGPDIRIVCWSSLGVQTFGHSSS